MSVNDGGPAFPVHGGNDLDDPRNRVIGGGMTLRDWFAGQAVSAIIRQCANDSGAIPSPETYFAAKAYEVADAMIAARAKGDGK